MLISLPGNILKEATSTTSAWRFVGWNKMKLSEGSNWNLKIWWKWTICNTATGAAMSCMAVVAAAIDLPLPMRSAIVLLLCQDVPDGSSLNDTINPLMSPQYSFDCQWNFYILLLHIASQCRQTSRSNFLKLLLAALFLAIHFSIIEFWMMFIQKQIYQCIIVTSWTQEERQWIFPTRCMLLAVGIAATIIAGAQNASGRVWPLGWKIWMSMA